MASFKPLVAIALLLLVAVLMVADAQPAPKIGTHVSSISVWLT
jgi:hypothetical protein